MLTVKNLMIVQSQLSNCNAAQEVSQALGLFTMWKDVFPEFKVVPYQCHSMTNELRCVSHR